MAIVMGLDQHRAQVTAEWIDTDTGELGRARVSLAHRDDVRKFFKRFAGQPLDVALEATTGWRFGAAVSLLVPAAAPWPLLAVAPAMLLGAARWSAAGWRVEHGRVAIRVQRLARVTVLAPVGRLQQHGVRQTALQGRARLADLELRVGAGTRGRVRHLDAAVAGRAFDALRRVDSGRAGERRRER